MTAPFTILSSANVEGVVRHAVSCEGLSPANSPFTGNAQGKERRVSKEHAAILRLLDDAYAAGSGLEGLDFNERRLSPLFRVRHFTLL